MANELYKILDYTINHFESDLLVNNVTDYDDDLIDTNKYTVYPVVNIDDFPVTIAEDQIALRLKITVLDQVEVYQHSTDSKLKFDTNYFDIISETSTICQKFINSFRQYNDSDIEMESVTELEPIKNKFINGLSGYEFEIILTVANYSTSCPQE